MGISVLTRAYDNARTGTNTHETILTAQRVATQGVRRLYSLNLPGDARGVEAQPLVVSGVTLPDGTTRDIVYLATMSNQIWAFDLADGTLLWERTLGRPIQGSQKIDEHNINDHWGVLSTPVIDVATQILYAVAWISPNGSVPKADHWVYALRITDGTYMHAPLNLEDAKYEPGHGIDPLFFKSAQRKQRASLLLTDVNGTKTLFVGFGSLEENAGTSRGWVVAIGTAPFEVTAAWAATARGHGAGIWQAGAGLVADPNGGVYAMTGNGAFDGVTDFGECFIKLAYTPPTGGAAARLTIDDWWAPWTDKQRIVPGLPDEDDLPHPTNYRNYEQLDKGSANDMDLGSGGPVLVDQLGALIGCGKDGVLYVVDANNMGRTSAQGVENADQNYAKLKSPPIFYSYYVADLNPAPDDIRELNVLSDGRTHHLHGGSIYWNSPDLGRVLYCWGENGNLRAWSLSADATVRYLACSAEMASASMPAPPGSRGGMPGGMLTLSANADHPKTGIVWACIPYFDANAGNGPGRLLAYDATQFGTYPDGSKQLRVLWDSQQWGLEFTFNKFNVPVVANGRLIVPTYGGRVDIYG